MACRFLPLFFLALLTACSTLNENQCRVGDWSGYGRVDGTRGRTADYWREHDSACRSHGVSVDREKYEAGRRDGIASYCTPESGYLAGARGESYLGVCKDLGEAAFTKQFESGRRVYLLRRDQVETDRQLEELKKNEKKDRNLGETIVDALGWTPESMKRNQLESQRRLASTEITRLEASAPVETPSQYDLRPGELSGTLGAYTGTIIGFGTGHAIQGRYARRGWIFTVSQVGALAAMAALPSACAAGNANCAGIAVGTGLVAFLASRIWESADAFGYAGSLAQGYPHIE